MGSSSWSYSVPYQGDVNAALQRLRQEVFECGEYYRESPGDGLNRARPTGPDTLVDAQPHSGTHSVIDMVNGVSAEPAFATVSPLAPDNLAYTFGTETPTAGQVETELLIGDLRHERDRWVGTYIVSYHDGRPDRIHFFGSSGD
ncbi:hypothetical protein [Dactylosporangium salmoneum]|uniref:Uncharacterized protein n=1 Tax=Dactylosporangium salmoneum TaxID=53361 RepID=A0ABP5V902_9ACTN